MEIQQEQTARLRRKTARELETERARKAEAERKASRRKALAPLRIEAHRFGDQIANQLLDGSISSEEAEARIMAFVAVNDSTWNLTLVEMDHLEMLVREKAGVGAVQFR